MFPRSFIVAAGSALLLLPVMGYYLFRKKKVSPNVQMPASGDCVSRTLTTSELKVDGKNSSITETVKDFSLNYNLEKDAAEHFNFKKEHVTPETARILNQLLNSPDSKARYQALVMIQQSSAFTSNYKILTESNCLDSMLKMFHNEDYNNSSKNPQSLCILQTLTNMVCDLTCLEIIKDHIDEVIQIASCPSYSDQACAALQVLCNVALTPTGCCILHERLPKLFAMLETRDPYMLRQVFSVLLNLSCNKESCDLILSSEAPDYLVERIKDCLSPATQPLVLLQLVNFLKNLYRAIRRMDEIEIPQSEAPSTREFLLNSRVALKVRVQFVLSEPSIADTNQELVRQAEALLNLIIGPELPSTA